MSDSPPRLSSLLAGLPASVGFGDATLAPLGRGTIDLGIGNPDPALLPLHLHRDAFRAVTESDAFAPSLEYSSALGLLPLRTAIAAREGVAVERVIITNGGAHGLALAAVSLLDPGDLVVVDDPVYPLFLRALDLVGVELASIPVRADGIDTDELERRLRAGLRPRALYTVPTFQNPSGATLSAEREAALVALAETYGFTIIADDPYRAIAFPGAVVPDRRAFRDSDRVVSVNTFSKTLGPGLRLGWLVLPEALTGAFALLRNRIDGQTSGLLQAVVERMLHDERLDAAIAAAGEGYARKAGVLATALREELGDAVELADPRGGYFAWARVRGDIDPALLYARAEEQGVTYQRGEWFASRGAPFSGFLRLSFSEASEDRLVDGVSRLGEAWRQLTRRG